MNNLIENAVAINNLQELKSKESSLNPRQKIQFVCKLCNCTAERPLYRFWKITRVSNLDRQIT